MEKRTLCIVIFISIFLFSYGAGNKDKKYTTPSAMGSEERNDIIEKEKNDESMNKMPEDDFEIMKITTEQGIKREKSENKIIKEPVVKKDAENISETKKENTESEEAKEIKYEKTEKAKEINVYKKGNEPLYSITLSIPLKNADGKIKTDVSENLVENKKMNEKKLNKNERRLNEKERIKIAEVLGEKYEEKETGVTQKEMNKYSEKSEKKSEKKEKVKSNKKDNQLVLKGGVNLESHINLEADTNDMKLKSAIGINGSLEYNRIINNFVLVGAGAAFDGDTKIKSDIKNYKEIGMLMIPVYAFMKFKTEFGMIDPFIQIKYGYSNYIPLNETMKTTRIEGDMYFGANIGLEIDDFIIDSGYSVEKYIAVDKTTQKYISIYYPKVSASVGYKFDF